MERGKNISGLVTLTTDWNQADYYCGMLKGRLVSGCAGVQIIDLSHQVPSFSIHSAAFVVRHSYQSFPPGTIHMVMVNSDSEPSTGILFTQQQEHFFVVPDNGLMDLLFSAEPSPVYRCGFAPDSSFASLGCMVGVVSRIHQGQPLGSIGAPTNGYQERISLRPTIDESIINGSIIYIDSYQNAISNISRSLFERVGQGRDFDIYVQSNYNHIKTLCTAYHQVEAGSLLALFNSAELLEVAIRDGFAAQLLSLSLGSGVRVKFR